MDNLNLVDMFWERFDIQDFNSAKELLRDDLEVIWPASRETFANSSEFIDMNVNFPGRWQFKKFKTKRLSQTEVLSVVNVFSPDADERFFATSIMTLRGGQIARIETYWAQEGNQPEWRKKYSTCY